MKAKRLVDLFKKNLARSSQETDQDINYTYILLPDNKPKTIGRHPNCDIVTSNSPLARTVSRCHAEIVYETNGTMAIWNKKGRNGTYISREKDSENPNGKPERIEVTERTQIYDKDIIQLGPLYCLMVLPYDEKAEESKDDTIRKADTETDLKV
ncbi:FHA domain-containing protein [archaeon]|jgi:pSer/pThr/pTyr-binding forkhead associated (FHA) protein|nr:FHA domain-containing protein [archaeon]MBT4241983.1 FHA domain-containing protein [archaeon]MBT4418530.1 FHA domain-containing protein [archaeon]